MLRSIGGSAARIAYGCYTWLALLAVVIPTCVLLAVAPKVDRRRRIARSGARLFFGAIGSPVRVEGAAVGAHYPCVVVANHASYLDGIILTAALPAGFTYLIKHEMATFPIAGFVLRRLGSAFVNRDDLLDRKRIARELLTAAVKGDALGFFPEGTFDAAPGLKAFQLGAFGAAVRANLPVVPVLIYGSRRKLAAGRVLPAPGPLRIHVCAPLHPSAYGSARELMHATRQAMLAELGEPDLALPRPAAPEPDALAHIPPHSHP